MKQVKSILFLVVYLTCCFAVNAQRCGGQVNLRIFSPGEARMQSFAPVTENSGNATRFSNGDCKIRITGKSEALFRVVWSDNFEFLTLHYGCSTAEKIRIHRRGRCGSMTIHFEDLCDLDFGLDVEYQRGVYHLNVCEPGRKISLLERYPSRVNAGLDITPEKWKRGKCTKKCFSTRHWRAGDKKQYK
jgi:hypothetical protein